MKCIKCNTEIEQDAQFCIHCGTKQPHENMNQPDVDFESDVDVKKDAKKRKNILWVIIILIALLFAVGGIYYGVKKDRIRKHECVDLGLPSGTLWATCNIGANSPEEYGDYFAWGETEGYNSGKTDFSWDTYKWCKGNEDNLTKYCTESRYGNNGFTDNKTELDLKDDAAYVNWGPDWHIPSIEQFNELIDEEFTSSEWTSLNGVNGYKITSKINGNSIFLPAAGYRDGSSLDLVGTESGYCSRTLNSDRPYSARGLYFCIYSSGFDADCFYLRYGGSSVRPVRLSE